MSLERLLYKIPNMLNSAQGLAGTLVDLINDKSNEEQLQDSDDGKSVSDKFRSSIN